VKPKYKVIALITIAVLTMTALVHANLHNVRDERPPRWSPGNAA